MCWKPRTVKAVSFKGGWVCGWVCVCVSWKPRTVKAVSFKGCVCVRAGNLGL